MMTRTQREKRARSYRLMAGKLYYDLSKADKDDLSQEEKGELRAAHDALCRLFNKLET